MPTLLLRVASPQSPAPSVLLAQALTDLTVTVLRKRREVTAVLVQELPAACWHIGGRGVSRPAAWLQIDITEGTNTAEEKARFVANAWAVLQAHLSPAGGPGLAEASYVTVRELPATDWGYGGQTQAARAAARLATPPLA